MSSLILEAQKNISTHGGRMTGQRRLILQTLEELSGHPTAEELYLAVREADPMINLSTVYRTLNWLQEERLIQSRLFDEDRRHRHFDPGASGEHYHFLCLVCGQVEEFDSRLVETIKHQFELNSRALVESGSVIFYGQCATCQEKGA